MTKLEKITYILLITVSVVSLGIIIEARVRNYLPGTSQSAPRILGTNIDLPGADWSQSDLSLVLLMSEQCHFCSESMPFYRELSRLQQANAAHVSLVVVSADQAPRLKDYLKEQAINPSAEYHLVGGLKGINLTPTIFLVNSSGVIQKAYVGKLNLLSEHEIIESLRKGKV